MTEARRSLFDKPLPELREAFVRARFAEDAFFGQPDIEEALAEERESKVEPSERRIWPLHRNVMRALKSRLAVPNGFRILASDARRIVRQYATPIEERFGGMAVAARFSVMLAEISPVFDALTAMDSSSVVYAGDEHAVIFDRVHDKNSAFLARPSGKAGAVIEPFYTNGSRVTATAVIDVLYSEWRNRRPKWREACEFLCRALEIDIAKERTKAEHDFDTAVAVSADGTKICHAERVCVFGETRDADDLWYDGACFHKQKARLNAERLIRKGNWGSPMVSVIAEDPDGCASRNLKKDARTDHTQQLDAHADGRILYLHRDQCPDPLPAGGTPVGRYGIPITAK